MNDDHVLLVERIFDAFNRRDLSAIDEICDENVEFFPITGEALGRRAPYMGPAGLREYLAEMSRIWEELQITPSEIARRGDRVLVRGRVYVRSHELGIRDMPVAWIWKVRDGRFVWGQVFPDPEEAVERFTALSA